MQRFKRNMGLPIQSKVVILARYNKSTVTISYIVCTGSHGRSQRSPREVNLPVDRDVLAIAAVECVAVRRKRKREKESASSHGYHSTLHHHTGRPRLIGQWCHTDHLQVFVSPIYVNKVVSPDLNVLTMGSFHTKSLPYDSIVSAHARTCSVGVGVVATRGSGGAH